MSFKWKCVGFVTPLIILSDQWTKWLVQQHIPFGTRHPIIADYLDLVHVTNTGAAFGMFADGGAWWREPFFYGIALVALVVMGRVFRQLGLRERLMPLVLALILGGLVGNLIDRVRFGAVTDFVAVHWCDTVWSWSLWGWHARVPLEWPAFNIADSAITVSMVLLIAHFVRPVRRS